jgi:prolipoprotein diacylglyceryltransferase
MWDEVFVLCMLSLFLLMLRWACRTLPGEGWQIMGSVPITKNDSGTWVGMNLTYYGLFVSIACVLAVAIFLLLMGAIGVQAKISLLIVSALLGLCVPASGILARLVEKKHHTLTVGGASFLGVLMTPLVLWCADEIAASTVHEHVPMVPAMASLAIGYAVGEGIGRMACISFGCCYGKPLSECHGLTRRVIGQYNFVFAGATKKIAYESGLDGEPVVPIQAMTAVVYVAVGLGAMLLYLRSNYCAAFAVSMIVTQTWRALSENLRADYRGGGTISAYQIMAAVAVVYTVGLLWVLPFQQLPTANLMAGMTSLWDPTVPLYLEFLGLAVFLFSGRSKVTAATLSFHVLPDRL